jgi:hypothetical protein
MQPIFQRGETPYVNEGVGVELDADAQPELHTFRVRAMATDFWVTSLDGVPGLRE